MRYLKYIILFLCATGIFAQIPFEGGNKFFLDAVVFKSRVDTVNARIDVYVLIPYESLQFQKASENYAANIEIKSKLFNSNKKKISENFKEKSLLAEDYETTQGLYADFYKYYSSFDVSEGSYEVEVEIRDKFTDKVYLRNREISVVDYRKYDLALSGLMLVSQIEEIDGSYKITPHISDNVGNLSDGYFVFFEVYNQQKVEKVYCSYRLEKDGEVVEIGKQKEIKLDNKYQQAFLRVENNNLKTGTYTLQVFATDKAGEEVNSENIIAASQRSIKSIESLSDVVMGDINKAIKQLRFVATDDEIDEMEEAKSKEKKKELFRQFWKERDPTEKTARNEAFIEYFGRVRYANQTFKSYTEGWRTDMGMVYIVLGPPARIESRNQMGSNIEYKIWSYNNNRQFIFADRNGFGDYRLQQPYTFNEKYRYRR